MTNLSEKLDKDSTTQIDNNEIVELTESLVIGFQIQIIVHVNIGQNIRNP